MTAAITASTTSNAALLELDSTGWLACASSTIPDRAVSGEA